MITSGKDRFNQPLVEAMAAFERKFAKSALKGNNGRAQRQLKGDIGKDVTTRLLQLVPPIAKMKPELYNEQLQEICETTCYAVPANKVTASTEAGQLAVLRYTTKGSRELIVCPYHALAAFVQAKTGKPVTTQDAIQFLYAAEVPMWKQFAEASTDSIFYGTIGPKDTLYLPAGWIFYERVKAASPTFGVRTSFFGKIHGKLLEASIKSLAAGASEPEPCLQAAYDLLQAHDD